MWQDCVQYLKSEVYRVNEKGDRAICWDASVLLTVVSDLWGSWWSRPLAECPPACSVSLVQNRAGVKDPKCTWQIERNYSNMTAHFILVSIRPVQQVKWQCYRTSLSSCFMTYEVKTTGLHSLVWVLFLFSKLWWEGAKGCVSQKKLLKYRIILLVSSKIPSIPILDIFPYPVMVFMALRTGLQVYRGASGRSGCDLICLEKEELWSCMLP